MIEEAVIDSSLPQGTGKGQTGDQIAEVDQALSQGSEAGQPLSQDTGAGLIVSQEAASLLRFKTPRGFIVKSRLIDQKTPPSAAPALPSGLSPPSMPNPVPHVTPKSEMGEASMDLDVAEAELDNAGASTSAVIAQQAALNAPEDATSAGKPKRSRPYTHGLPRGSKYGSLPPLDVVSKLRTLLPTAPVPVKESPPRLRTLLPAPPTSAPTPIILIRQGDGTETKAFIIDGTGLQAQGGGTVVFADANQSNQVR